MNNRWREQMKHNNQIETVLLDEGEVKFDHASGVMTARWNNGYTEKWSNHYGLKAHRNAFYLFTNQLERIENE